VLATSERSLLTVLLPARQLPESIEISFQAALLNSWRRFIGTRICCATSTSPIPPHPIVPRRHGPAQMALMLRLWGVPRARPTMDIDLLRR